MFGGEQISMVEMGKSYKLSGQQAYILVQGGIMTQENMVEKDRSRHVTSSSGLDPDMCNGAYIHSCEIRL